MFQPGSGQIISASKNYNRCAGIWRRLTHSLGNSRIGVILPQHTLQVAKQWDKQLKRPWKTIWKTGAHIKLDSAAPESRDSSP